LLDKISQACLERFVQAKQAIRREKAQRSGGRTGR